MSGLKVCVYGVCRNEEKYVDKWVDSMSEADMIIVTDTGSTDHTVEKLKQRNVEVHIDVITPWRFDAARNSCLKWVPEDVDICVTTDFDEVFEPGWRANLERAWLPGTKRAKYHFTWSFNPDGSPAVTYYFDRIHARKDYVWVNPTHEVLCYTGTEEERYVWCSDVRILHYPDLTKDRSFNLPLLELAIKERPEDARNWFYLGREYLYAKLWDQCIETLKKHITMPDSTYIPEKSASMRLIARSYKAKENNAEARKWLYRAIVETPYIREPYVEMAQLMYEEKDWTGVCHMVSDALKITERSTYINEPFCWDSTLYDLGSIACYHLGMKTQALSYVRTAMEMSPDDARLRNNYQIIERMTG